MFLEVHLKNEGPQIITLFIKKHVLINVFRGSSRSRKMRLEKCFPKLVLKLKTDEIKPSLRPFEGDGREITCF